VLTVGDDAGHEAEAVADVCICVHTGSHR
jgi:hypothetical protein